MIMKGVTLIRMLIRTITDTVMIMVTAMVMMRKRPCKKIISMTIKKYMKNQ
jgi:hypothetical protein